MANFKDVPRPMITPADRRLTLDFFSEETPAVGCRAFVQTTPVAPWERQKRIVSNGELRQIDFAGLENSWHDPIQAQVQALANYVCLSGQQLHRSMTVPPDESTYLGRQREGKASKTPTADFSSCIHLDNVSMFLFKSAQSLATQRSTAQNFVFHLYLIIVINSKQR